MPRKRDIVDNELTRAYRQLMTLDGYQPIGDLMAGVHPLREIEMMESHAELDLIGGLAKFNNSEYWMKPADLAAFVSAGKLQGLMTSKKQAQAAARKKDAPALDEG